MLVLWLCNQECKHHDLCILKGSLWFPQTVSWLGKPSWKKRSIMREMQEVCLHKYLIQLLLSWFISMQAFDRNWPFKSPVRRNDPMTDFSRRQYTLDMGFVSRQIDSTSWNGRVSDWKWHVYQIYVCSVVIFSPFFWCCWTWPRAPVNWFSPSIGAGSGPATGLAASQPMKLWSIEQKFCIFQRWNAKRMEMQKKQKNKKIQLDSQHFPWDLCLLVRLGHWVVSPARHNLGQRFALKWSLGKHICLDRSTSELVKDNFVIHFFI